MLENPKGMKNEYGPIRDKYCATEGKVSTCQHSIEQVT